MGEPLPDFEAYVKLSECADYFGLTRRWLRKAADEGSVPCLRVARQRMFRLSAVARALSMLEGHVPGLDVSKPPLSLDSDE